MLTRQRRFYNWLAIFTLTPILSSTFLQTKSLSQQQNPTAHISKNILSAQQIAARTLPSVVLIVCDNGSNASLGSGFFIRPGIVVTNYHVIKGMLRGTVRPAGGNKTGQRFPISVILDIDEKADLALLGVPEAKIAFLPTLTLNSSNTPKVGETIYALGNPEGLTGTISQGIISAGARIIYGSRVLQISASISHGSSGGPVVDSQGQVIGVAVGSITEGQNLNFAVPSMYIQSLLAKWENNILKDVWENLKPREGTIDGAWVFLQRPSMPASADASTPSPPSIIGPVRPGEPNDRASLRKLEGVHLLIENLDSTTKEFIGEAQLQTEVELRLRRNRIRVLSKDEMFKTPGMPYLYLDIRVMKMFDNPAYATHVTLTLYQDIGLTRDLSFTMTARTWDRERMALVGRSVAKTQLMRIVEELVDTFCNDFLAAQ